MLLNISGNRKRKTVGELLISSEEKIFKQGLYWSTTDVWWLKNNCRTPQEITLSKENTFKGFIRDDIK